MKNDIQDVVSLLHHTYGADVSMYEEDFLRKTLEKRLLATGNGSFANYGKDLATHPEEKEQLLASLHIGFSEFFRNPLTFSVIEQVILPSVLEKKKLGKEKEIRIWSAACASGQEPYSFAILCDELMENTRLNLACRIFATDISPAELSNAHAGVYQTASINKVSYKRMQKYFTRKGDNFIISSKLREYMDFSLFDLLTEQGESPPASIYGNFDLIFCSNVLFYYKPELRLRILDKLSKNLSPGGFLITGETERELLKNYKFREVVAHSAVFQKNN